MPHDVPIVVYRNGERVVIGSLVVNGSSTDGVVRIIGKIRDEAIATHLKDGGGFGTAEFCLGEPDDNRTRIIKVDI